MDIMNKIESSLLFEQQKVEAGFNRICPWCGEGYPVVENSEKDYQYADRCWCGCSVSEVLKKKKKSVIEYMRNIATNVMHKVIGGGR